jgi:hypothetical protein
MDNPIQNEAEMKELKHENSFGFTERAEANEGGSTPTKDLETMLSMIVLLLACLGLAALAHLIV